MNVYELYVAYVEEEMMYQNVYNIWNRAKNESELISFFDFISLILKAHFDD